MVISFHNDSKRDSRKHQLQTSQVFSKGISLIPQESYCKKLVQFLEFHNDITADKYFNKQKIQEDVLLLENHNVFNFWQLLF